jgi:hypothetical protein
MNPLVTFSARGPEYQRAFLALRYFWGARAEALRAGLGQPAQAPVLDLLAALGDESREVRAQALAGELGRLAADLDQRGLWK